jgi:hypothetical protein
MAPRKRRADRPARSRGGREPGYSAGRRATLDPIINPWRKEPQMSDTGDVIREPDIRREGALWQVDSFDPLRRLAGSLTYKQVQAARAFREVHADSGYDPWTSPAGDETRVMGGQRNYEPGRGPTAPEYLEACAALQRHAGMLGEQVTKAVVLEHRSVSDAARWLAVGPVSGRINRWDAARSYLIAGLDALAAWREGSNR